MLRCSPSFLNHLLQCVTVLWPRKSSSRICVGRCFRLGYFLSSGNRRPVVLIKSIVWSKPSFGSTYRECPNEVFFGISSNHVAVQFSRAPRSDHHAWNQADATDQADNNCRVSVMDLVSVVDVATLPSHQDLSQDPLRHSLPAESSINFIRAIRMSHHGYCPLYAKHSGGGPKRRRPTSGSGPAAPPIALHMNRDKATFQLAFFRSSFRCHSVLSNR